MAGSIKGITLEIGGDTTKLNQALKDSRLESRNLQSELRQVNTALKLDPGNVDMIRQKELLLSKEIDNQKAKLIALKAAKKQADEAAEAGTEVNEEGYRALEREIVKTQAAISKCTSELYKFGDSGEEIKKTTDNISEAGDEINKTGDRIKTVGSGLITAGKVIGGALAAAGAGAVKLIKESLDFAGELEQNMGGSEAVFKEHAAGMQKAAEEAYTKMGLSQSDYLATANKMGALFQGSGFSIKESADMSKKAMQAAADVASIMGIDVSMAMESVAGAAKGNFTMMDNLGVAMNDTTLKAYAQEKGLGELKTTHDKVAAAMQMFSEKAAYAAGNYEKENETLSGSLTTLKASFNNFMSGTGNPNQLADAISNAGNVITSKVKELVPALIKGLSGVVKQLIPQFVPMINEILPVAVDAIQALAQNFATVLPGLFQTVLPALGTALANLLVSLLQSLPGLAGALASGLSRAVVEVVKQLPQILMALVTAIPAAIVSLFDGLFSTTAAATAEQRKMKSAVEENGQAVEELTAKMENINSEYETAVENSKKTAENTLAEIEADKNLVSELENLIDANGKVKEGYEERVDYILGEMNSAYDTELGRSGDVITKNGEVVNSYGEIKNAIEANMDASMAAAIMKQYEDEYAAAVKRSAEALKAADEVTSTYGSALQTQNQLIADAKAKMEEYGLTAVSAADAIDALEAGSFQGYDFDGNPITVALNTETEAWQKNQEQIKSCQEIMQEYSEAQTELATIESQVNSARAASAEGDNQRIVDSYALSADELKHINEQNTSDLLADINNRKAGIESTMGMIMAAVEKGDTATAKNLYTLLETSVANLKTLETEYKNAGGNAPTEFVKGLEEKQGIMKTAVNEGGEAAIKAYNEVAGKNQWQVCATNSIAGLLAVFGPAKTTMYNAGYSLATNFKSGYKAGDKQNSPSKAMKECGNYTIAGLMQGILPGIDKAEKAGIDTATAYRDGYINAMDINSPSKEMHKVGSDTTQGLLNGLDEHTREIIKLAEDTGDDELETAKFYASEKQRIEDENFDKEYAEKLKNAKDAEAAEKIKQDYIAKAQKEGQDNYLKALKSAADFEKKQYDEKVKAAENFKKEIEKIFESFKKIFSSGSSSLTQKYTLKTKDGKTEEWQVLKNFTEEAETVGDYAGKLISLQRILPENMFNVIKGLNMTEGNSAADLLLKLTPEELAGQISGWGKYNSMIAESAGALTVPFLSEADDSYKIAAISESALAKWAANIPVSGSSVQEQKSILVENNFYTSQMSPAEVATEMTSALKREALLI